MEVLSIQLFTFVAIAAFTPGPNNLMMMASGLNHGVRASLPHFFGICFGVPTILLVAGTGLGFFFQRYPIIHMAIQLIGVVYLLYLAWLIASSAPASLDSTKRRPLSFFQAVLFQWVNPKTWMMGTSAISAFTVVDANITTQITLVIGVFFLMVFPSAGVWLVFGVHLKKLLAKPSHQRAFNISMGVCLAIIGLSLIWDMTQA